MSEEIKIKPTELSQEQKDKIVAEWNKDGDPPSLDDLCILIWNKRLDLRSSEGKLIKSFVATLSPRDIKSRDDKVKVLPDLVLTEEQKEFVGAHKKTMNSMQIARDLFGDPHLPSLSREVKAVVEYKNSLDVNGNEQEDDIPDGPFKSPKSPLRAAMRVNKYIQDAIDLQTLDKNTKVQNILKFVIKCLQLFRFNRMVNTYTTLKDRELFEASYIKYVWEMPDLNEAELDLLCNLCSDIVSFSIMQEELEQLKELRDTCADDTEGKRISMSIVESIKGVREDINANQKRQDNVIKALQGTRNERVDTKTKENASLVQLIEFWKNSETRQQILALAELRRKNLRDECDRIKTMDELKIQMFGIHPEEIINS